MKGTSEQERRKQSRTTYDAHGGPVVETRTAVPAKIYVCERPVPMTLVNEFVNNSSIKKEEGLDEE
jgi:hypothetical protein